MARSLVDTNILVYSRDLNEPVKRARAIEVIDQLRASEELVLSAQRLIWATARDAGVPIVLSEDFQDGREIEGVRFVNPFKPS